MSIIVPPPTIGQISRFPSVTVKNVCRVDDGYSPIKAQGKVYRPGAFIPCDWEGQYQETTATRAKPKPKAKPKAKATPKPRAGKRSKARRKTAAGPLDWTYGYSSGNVSGSGGGMGDFLKLALLGLAIGGGIRFFTRK